MKQLDHSSASCLTVEQCEFIFFLLLFLSNSVSSFVKKTTEKINTLQMNSELRHRPEFKESAQPDTLASTTSYSDEMEIE